MLSYMFLKLGLIASANLSITENLAGIFYSNAMVFAQPCSNTWFILTLFLVELLFYGLKTVCRTDRDLGFAVGLLFLLGYANTLSEYNQPLPWHLGTVFVVIVFYFAGYLLIKNIERFQNLLENNKKLIAVCCAFLLLAGGCACFCNAYISTHGNSYGSVLLFLMSTFCNIFVFVYVSMFLKNATVLKNIGQYSLFYLGYHVLLIGVLKKYLPWFQVNTWTILFFSLCLLAVLYPFAWMCYRYMPILVGKLPSPKSKRA